MAAYNFESKGSNPHRGIEVCFLDGADRSVEFLKVEQWALHK
jgi:hypothetical protein